MKNKKRIKWIDFVKGLCMYWIIVSHIGAPDLYVRFYTPFFLTSFFFISGYTWNPKNNFKQYLQGKVKGLVIPLLSLGSINAVIAIVIEGDSWIYRFGGLILQRSCVWDDLWFLACLFSAQIIFYLIYNGSKNIKKIHVRLLTMGFFSLILAIAAYIYILYINIKLPWQFENACILSFFVFSGYLYRNIEFILIFYEKNRLMLPVILCLYFVCIYIVDNNVNIHSERYGNFLGFILCSTIGTYSFILFSKKMENINYSKKIYSLIIWVGKNTLVFYAFQSKVIKIVKIIYNKLDIPINTYFNVFLAASIIYLVLILPAFVINKWFPFILGKQKYNSLKGT